MYNLVGNEHLPSESICEYKLVENSNEGFQLFEFIPKDEEEKKYALSEEIIHKYFPDFMMEEGVEYFIEKT